MLDFNVSRPASFPDDVWKCVTDKARRETLAALDVMDTHADDDFARLNRLAADLFDVPSAAIAVVDDARSSLVSAFGTEIRQVELKESFAAHAMAGAEMLVVLDASGDARFKASALVSGQARHPLLCWRAGHGKGTADRGASGFRSGAA